jgi:hypothetical protein
MNHSVHVSLIAGSGCESALTECRGSEYQTKEEQYDEFSHYLKPVILGKLCAADSCCEVCVGTGNCVFIWAVK